MFELLGGCSRILGRKAVNLIQGRSSGSTEERIDPRDSEDIELTAFEREAEKCGFTFKHCVFGNQLVQFPKIENQVCKQVRQ